MADKKIDPFEHVVDSSHIDILPTAGLTFHLPEITVWGHPVPIKFMLLMTGSAILVAVAMIWLGRRMRSGEPPRGRLWNMMESLLFFVRDKIAVPGIGPEWLQRLESAVQRFPRDMQLAYALGHVLAERQLWGKARLMLEQAAEDRSLPVPSRRRSWLSLAELAAQDGDLERRARCFEAAATLQ